MHMWVGVCVWVSVCVFVCVCLCVYACVCIYTHKAFTTRAASLFCIHIMYVNIHIYMRMCTYIEMDIYTCTFTHNPYIFCRISRERERESEREMERERDGERKRWREREMEREREREMAREREMERERDLARACRARFARAASLASFFACAIQHHVIYI